MIQVSGSIVRGIKLRRHREEDGMTLLTFIFRKILFVYLVSRFLGKIYLRLFPIGLKRNTFSPFEDCQYLSTLIIIKPVI